LRQRLYREAQSAGGLNHPNIVTIYDIGEEGEVAYIAMEYVEGETLEHWMAGHPLPPIEQTASILEQVASGLDFAATKGIIHRDIKPGNILLTPDLRAKIADFGIAKFSLAKITMTGLVMGTPSYMSPEQAMGKELDGRSDIFSLGIIFYEMLTGERPFTGTNPTTIIYKILHEEPVSPRKLNVTLHPGYDYIVRRMLEKDPDARYQTCAEFIADLHNYKTVAAAATASARAASATLATPSVAPPPTLAMPPAAPRMPAPAPRRSFALPVLAFLVVIMAGALVYFYVQTRGNTPAFPPDSAPATRQVPAAPVPAPPAASPPNAQKEVPPPTTAEPPVSEQAPKPAPEPPPKPALASVSLSSEAPYPLVILDGNKRLDGISRDPMQIRAGEHRFRLVSDEVFLDRQLERVRLKENDQFSIPVPGLASAYIEVPDNAYEGCEITLSGRKVPTPYPAPIPRLASGEHRIVFKWGSGRFAGSEVSSLITVAEKHHYLVRGEPETGKVTVVQAR
jgi:serine/threonine-protein kinase